MDVFTVGLFAYVIGSSIFQKIAEDNAKQKKDEENKKVARIKANAEFKRKLKRQEAFEAVALAKKERPFKTAIECFKKQYVSYTRISTYASCPHRFKLIYMDRKKCIEPMYWSSPFGSKGKILHQAVETYLREYLGQTVPKLDYREIVNEAFKLYYLKNNKQYWSPKKKEFENRKRKKFRDNAKFLCKTLPKEAEIIAIEKELTFHMDKIKFYGIVDLVLKYPDGHLEIVDYKTGLRLPTKEQPEIYSIPFVNNSHCPSISFRIICVDRECHYRWSQNRNEMVESSGNILRIVNTITDDKTFAPAIASHCQNCSVQHVCIHSEKYKTNSKKVHTKTNLTKLSSKYEWKQKFDTPLYECNEKKNQNVNKNKKIISPKKDIKKN